MSALHVHRIVTGSLLENCYVVSHPESDAVVVDPGGEFDRIAAHVAASDLRVHAVVNTHAHPDHLAAASEVVEAYGATFHLHSDDEPLLPRANFYRRFIEKAEPIRVPTDVTSLTGVTALAFGALDVAVIHTPGHTPGSVCFGIGDALFTGDTLMDGGLGRADLPGGDERALEASVALIAERYPAETVVYPGHGESGRLGEVVAARASTTEPRA